LIDPNRRVFGGGTIIVASDFRIFRALLDGGELVRILYIT
jgi:hypothetical protein